MIYPLKNWNELKRGYLFRERTWYNRHHLGLDLIAERGTPIYAPCDGWVRTMTGFQGGKTIWFYWDNYIMRVLHLSMFARKGEVKEGDIIGYVGSTGKLSRGCHAHIDISKGNVNIWDINNFIDPELFFNNNDMLKILTDGKDQFILGKDGKVRLIYNVFTLNEQHNAGVIDKNVVERADISKFERGGDIIIVNPE